MPYKVGMDTKDLKLRPNRMQDFDAPEATSIASQMAGQMAGEVLRFAPVGIIYAEHRVIRYANQMFEEMFGLNSGKAEGLSIELLYPSPEDSERRVALAQPFLREAGHYSDQRVMARHNGELFWCAVMGRSLTLEDAFAKSIWCFIDQTKHWALGNLSARDRAIAILLCEGKTAKEIARQLGLSFRTVESYIARLKRKLQVRNAAELVSRLRAHGDFGQF